MEFHETRGGHEFYYGTMPRLARGIEELNESLKTLNSRFDDFGTQKENAPSANIQFIADKTGLSANFIQALTEEAFDSDIGETIDGVTEEGVYIMDIMTNINHYTMEPIPFNDFINSLLERIKQKTKCSSFTCKDCAKYGDLHSSCFKVRDLQVNEDTPACEELVLRK